MSHSKVKPTFSAKVSQNLSGSTCIYSGKATIAREAAKVQHHRKKAPLLVHPLTSRSVHSFYTHLFISSIRTMVADLGPRFKIQPSRVQPVVATAQVTFLGWSGCPPANCNTTGTTDGSPQDLRHDKVHRAPWPAVQHHAHPSNAGPHWIIGTSQLDRI